QRIRGGHYLRCELLQVSFDSLITGFDLALEGIEDLEVLLQHEYLFGAVVSGEGGGYLLFRRMAASVPMLSEFTGVGLTPDDVAYDPQACGAPDVRDDDLQLEVHLD